MLGTCLREVLRPATWLIPFVLSVPSWSISIALTSLYNQWITK
jgi:hypothetical protein